MKLKKSYILLIVMAIFLLISIGSACASDNITDDSDATLADDGESVVLSNSTDTGGNVPDDTNEEKLNTTIETENDTYKFSHDSDKNISVKVKANNSDISVNKTDIKIFEGNATINFEYDNNTMITIKNVLSVGNHTLTINYLGNDKYINSTKIITVQVYGNNTIETETSVVCNGKNIEIPVKVHDGVEYIELVKSNFNLTLVYTNESGNISNLTIKNFTVEDGKIKFNKDDNEGINLIAGTLIIDYANATEPKNVSIKVSTTVEAIVSKDKFESEEIKNISITVLNGQGNLNVSQNDLKVFENGKPVTFTYDNNTNVMTVELDVGIHNLTIVYNGDETYNSSSASVVVKVNGSVRFHPSECVGLDESNTATITINLTDGVDPVNIIKNNLTVDLFYTVGNKTYNHTNLNFELNGQDITFIVSEAFDKAYVNIKYSENNLTAKTTIKVGTIINASDVQYADSAVKNLTVGVKGTDGQVINITKNNVQVLKDGKALTIEVNNSVITIKDAITFGAYNLTVKYLGNDKYIASNKTVVLTVYGINATKTTTVNSTKIGNVNVTVVCGNATVDINKDDLTINITYKDGNNTVVANITEYSYNNGVLSFTLQNATFTTATLNIKYNDTETNVALNRIYNARIELITTTNEYKTGNFTFRLVDIDDGSNITGKPVNLTNVGNLRVISTATTDANGIAIFKTAKLYIMESINSGSISGETLSVGTYAYEVKAGGNVKADKVLTNLTVTPAHVKISIDKYEEYYGSTKNVMIHVTNSANEPVSGTIVRLVIKDVGTYYMYTNGSGIAQISLYSSESKRGLVGGDYEFTAYNNDTKNIVNTSAKSTVKIKKIPVVISAKDVTVQYNSYTYTIKVTKNGKAVSGVYLIVRVYTTSSKYSDYLFQTNSKGTISLGAPLDVGKHKIGINSADNRYEAKQVTKTITVKKATATIKVSKVTDYYKGTKVLKIKVVNSKTKKAMYYTKVNLKLYFKNKYYTQDLATQADGYVRLSLDGLKPNTYKVVVSCKDKKNYEAKKATSKLVIKKAPAKLTPKKLTAKKGAKKYFKVTVKNKKTKKVIKGVKVKIKVYTGKKSKTYTVKTNKKGVAKLLTKKLKVGKHKVIVTSANKYVVAKKAKSTIKIKK